MAVNRYIQAVALCNNLALLASQGTKTIFIHRVGLLTKLLKGWMKGLALEIMCSDPEGDNYLKQISAKNMETLLSVNADMDFPGSILAIYREESNDDTITEPWQLISDDEDEEDQKKNQNAEKISNETQKSVSFQQQLKEIMTNSSVTETSLGFPSDLQNQQMPEAKPGESVRNCYAHCRSEITCL